MEATAETVAAAAVGTVEVEAEEHPVAEVEVEEHQVFKCSGMIPTIFY